VVPYMEAKEHNVRMASNMTGQNMIIAGAIGVI
jgi:hypothetical protein